MLGGITAKDGLRVLSRDCDGWRDLGMICFYSLGLRNTSTEADLAALAGEINGVKEISFDQVVGLKRLPYEDRGEVLRVLCDGGAGTVSDSGQRSSGNGATNNTSSGIRAMCLRKLQEHFIILSNSLGSISDLASVGDATLLYINLYHGVAKSINDYDYSYSNSEETASNNTALTNIPAFVTPALPTLSKLLSLFADNLVIVGALLNLFRDYAEQHISYLNAFESVELYKASTELLKGYCGTHTGSKRSIVAYRGGEDDEEEQAYADVLSAIQLLNFLASKDFLDMNNDAGKVDSGVNVTDVIFYGLSQILPLMTAGLLQYPRLTSQFFLLTGFTIENYPEKLCTVPTDLVAGIMESMAWGTTHSDPAVCRSCLRGIESIAKEHLKTKSLQNVLMSKPDLFNAPLSKIIGEVVFTRRVFDRVEACGGAIGALIAVDLNFFVSVCEAAVNEFCGGNHSLANQIRKAFEVLADRDVLAKIVANGFVGRQARMKFNAMFDSFVKETSKFLRRK